MRASVEQRVRERQAARDTGSIANCRLPIANWPTSVSEERAVVEKRQNEQSGQPLPRTVRWGGAYELAIGNWQSTIDP